MSPMIGDNTIVTRKELLEEAAKVPENLVPLAATVLRDLRERVDPARRTLRLGGLWKGEPPVSEEDIRQVRQEMWGHLDDEPAR